MFRQFLSLAVGLAAFLGPAAAAKAAPDLSTPKAAMMTFTKAIVDHDLETIKASMIGTEEQRKYVEGLSDLLASVRRVKTAADAKYGEENTLSFFARGMTDTSGFVADAARTEFKVDGDIATRVSRDCAPANEMSTLRKVDGGWKVDLSSLSKEDLAGAAELAKLATDLNDFAGEIETGKYKTVEEAIKAIEAKMAEARK